MKIANEIIVGEVWHLLDIRIFKAVCAGATPRVRSQVPWATRPHDIREQVVDHLDEDQ